MKAKEKLFFLPSLSKMEHHEPQQIAILITGISRNLNLKDNQ